MAGVDPVLADRIRKATAAILAVGGTVLLFRVLGRTAGGRQRLLDPELLLLLLVAAATLFWVRAAVRVRRAASAPPPAATGAALPHGHRCPACGGTWACRGPSCAGTAIRPHPACEPPAGPSPRRGDGS